MDTTVILRPPDAPQPLILSHAIAAGEPPAWSEAVAIIREIALQIGRSEQPAVPALDEIAVLASGMVEARGGRPLPAGPVHGLGALMAQMLERGGAPPPVLEIQRQAQAEPPVFPTVHALYAALEYYARPDAHRVLADFYNRAAVALEVAAKNQALEALKEKSKTAAETEGHKKDKKPRPRRRRLLWAAAVILVPLAAAGAAWRFGFQSAPRAAGTAAAALEILSSTGKDVADKATRTIAGLIGGSLTPGNEPPSEPTPPPTPTSTVPRKARPSQADKPTAPKVDPSTAPSTKSPVEAPPADRVPDLPPPLHVVAEDRIYTASDADVRAPILVHPQLPTRRDPNALPPEPGELDLLVLEDGTVAEVRLIPVSNRFQDRMLISAAKAWRFRPADLNGQPVRYRLRIPITW